MRKPFQEILHPPELHGAERRRYWLAAVGWLVCFLACLIGSYMLLYGILMAVYGDSPSNGNEAKHAVLVGIVICPFVGAFLGDYLWSKIFVSSGYLSASAVIRMRTNRAPTAKGERTHRKISLSLGVLIPALIGGLGWYGEQYWLIPLAMVFGLWLYFSLLTGWRKSDAIIDGPEVYPQSEAERVLHGLEKHRDQGPKPGP